MQIRNVIRRRIRQNTGGVDLASDVNAVLSMNVNRGHADHSAPERDVPSPPKTEEPKEASHE